MLSNIKMLLGIDNNEQDGMILLYKDIITQKVLNYCNRTDVPVELELILVDMIANEYRKVSRQKAIEKGAIESVKRGDTQINYAANSNDAPYNKLTGAGGADFIANYQMQLDRFVKTEEEIKVRKVSFI